MIQINNIVKRKNKSAKIFVVVLCCFLTGMVKYADTKCKDNPGKTIVKHHTSNLEYLIGLIVLISFCMLGLSVTDYKDQRTSMDLTYRFILDYFMEDHPEIKQYVNVLKNPQNLNMLTNVICNILDKNEQNRIITVINAFDSKDLQHQNFYELTRLQHDIIDIVHRHFETNPEHAKIIKDLLENPNKTYIFNTHVRTR